VTPPPCLYCRRTDTPRTREHVLQAALGATATLPVEVCADCNAYFSAIDKYFLEAVAFYHTGKHMLRGLGFGRAVLADGTSVNARLRNDGLGEFPPQLLERGDGVWRFLGSREADLHQMVGELAEPASLTVRTEVVKASEGVPRLAVLRSAPKVYLIQGTDGALVDRFAAKVRVEGMRAEWTGEPIEASDTATPPIKYDTALLLDPFCRAMAKVALNFVCYRLGPEVALRPEFDGVRRFARYGEGAFFDFAVPTVLNHTLGDTAAPFATPDHHALILATGGADGGRREAVFIAIEGRTVGRMDLTRGHPALPPGSWMLTRFDVARRTFEDLVLPDDMPRAVLNPAALGLQDIWPKEWL